jgi:hypothetical protein
MKRVLNFKTMLVLAMLLLVANGTFAQILTNYQNVAENSYQTAGMAFRLYVLPDPVYSPLYVAATNTGIDASAQWSWAYVGLTGAPANLTPTNQNYVEFTAPAIGVYTVGVTESNLLGGCSGAVVNQQVNVIAAPTATITTADPAQACGNQAAKVVAMTFTESVPVTWASYAFAVDELVENIDPAGTVIPPTVSHTATFVNFPTGGKLKAPALTGAMPTYGYTFNTSALAVANNLRTRYTYTLVSAAGVTGTGVVSAISQKSDYLTLPAITGYAFGAKTTYVAIVNPAPVTGPIYHIVNLYAY